MKAQQDIATAENAIAQQAEQLTGVLDPLLAAAAAAASQEAGTTGEAAGAPASPGDAGTPAGQPNGESGQPPAAAGELAAGQPASGQPAAPSFTAEQLAKGQQLARTLDELDRQQAAAAAAGNAAQPGQPSQLRSGLDAFAQAAQTQQAALAASRIRAQQEAAMALGQGGTESSDAYSDAGPPAEFGIVPVNRTELTNWGKLRKKSAEDLTKGKSEAISEEYRRSVETYFRVLGERSKKK